MFYLIIALGGLLLLAVVTVAFIYWRYLRYRHSLIGSVNVIRSERRYLAEEEEEEKIAAAERKLRKEKNYPWLTEDHRAYLLDHPEIDFFDDGWGSYIETPVHHYQHKQFLEVFEELYDKMPKNFRDWFIFRKNRILHKK